MRDSKLSCSAATSSTWQSRSLSAGHSRCRDGLRAAFITPLIALLFGKHDAFQRFSFRSTASCSPLDLRQRSGHLRS